MPVPIIRYQLDPTGENPNNLVVGEVHPLDDFPVRVLVPYYGPFYKDSIILYDLATNAPLDKKDYSTLHLVQDATLNFGQEVCEVIIISNPAVSNTVSLTYQNVGGNYQNNAQAVADTLQTLLKDGRKVDWVKGIFDKPYQYNPSIHPHLFNDVVGFAPLIVALERVAQAVTLSNVPAFEALITWVKDFQKSWVSEQEIRNMNPVEKIVSLERLLFAAKHLNFNAITFRPSTNKINIGGAVSFTISCTNLARGENLFWTVEHSLLGDGTTDSMFGSNSGIITPINQEASFNLNTLRSAPRFGQFHFRVVLRRNSVNGPILAETDLLTIENLDPNSNSDATVANGIWEHICCIEEPGIVPTAEAFFLLRDSINYQTL